MTQDGVELAEYLRTHLQKDRIVLVGHSWGSFLGIHMAKQRPDLFSAYVGTGQVVGRTTFEKAFEQRLKNWRIGMAGMILLGTFVAARRTGWSRQRLGISFDAEVALVAILALGIGLVAGFITYAIFEPLPPIVDLDLRRAVLPGVVLVVSAGIVEELLFRGLLQVAASELLGARVGTVFIAVLWTLAAVAPWSQTGLVAGFAIALGLAALTSQARSVIPAMAAHAGLVVSALLIAPFLQPGGPLS